MRTAADVAIALGAVTAIIAMLDALASLAQ